MKTCLPISDRICLRYGLRGVWRLAIVAVAGVPAVAGAAGLWARLYDPDPAVFVQHLRAAGMPGPEADLLIAHEVDRAYAVREKALEPPAATTEAQRDWWTPERRAAWLDLHRDKSRYLRQILGHAPDSGPKTDWIRETFPRLSPAQEDLVRAITADYDELLASERAAWQGHETRADLDTEIHLEENRSNELAEVLTPDEVADYEIRNSRLGRKLREDLTCFEPTQEELRTCLRVLHEVGHAADYLQTGIKIEVPVGGPFVGGPPRAYPRDLAARQALAAGLESLWSPERLEHFWRAYSSFYRTTFFIVRRLGLPDSVTDQIFDSRVAISATEAEVRPYNGPAASAPSRKFGRFPALAEQHCRLVRSLLGEKGYAEYLEQNRGWIDRMRRAEPVEFRQDF